MLGTGGGGVAFVQGESRPCDYGRWGLFGRAVRDARYLVVNNNVAALVVAGMTIVVGPILFETGPHTSKIERIGEGVFGLLVGFAIGMAMVAVAYWTP